MSITRYVWKIILFLALLISMAGCSTPVTTFPEITLPPAPTSTFTLAPTLPPTATQTPVPPSVTPTSHPTQTPLPTLSGSGGGVLAFVADDGKQRDIYLMSVSGTDRIPLTFDAGWDNWPSWSPDGMHLTFTCRAPVAGLGGGICRINADGSEREVLTSSNDWEPSWSPDGRYIAFASQRDGNPEIYMMNADGTDQRRLTHFEYEDWQAAWSPDSTRLAFARGRGGNWDIYIMDVSDGGIQGDAEVVRLTDNDAADGFPAWSPDGNRIVFSSERDGTEEIYIMNADGSDQQRLTFNDVDDTFPRWSPDGQRIVYATSTLINSMHSNDLMLMNADGSNQHMLTRTAMIEEVCPNWRPVP